MIGSIAWALSNARRPPPAARLYAYAYAGARRGIVLPLVLAILVLLVIMAGAIHLLRHQTYKGLDRLDGFLRAVSVGEAAHGRIVARLEAAPWSQRWFAGSSDTGTGTWDSGSYSTLIADGPGPAEADLIVNARQDTSQVVMFWRLRGQTGTLSPFRQVRTLTFSYLDPETPADTTALTQLRADIAADIAARQANAGWAMETEDAIGANPAPDRIAATLGVTLLAPPPSDFAPLVPGAPPVSIGTILSGGPEPTLPPLPSPPPLAQPQLPATGAVIVALAQGRTNLRDGLMAAIQAQVMLATAKAKMTAINAQCTAIQATCHPSPPASPPPDPNCDRCDKCLAAMSGAQSAFLAQAAQDSSDIQECMDSINNSADAIDNAAAQSAIFSGGTAVGLTQQADSTSNCGQDVKSQVTQHINDANSKISGPCGQSMAP